jgi:signal peptide peptidase SppA
MNHLLFLNALLGLEWAIDPERGRALLEIVTGEADHQAVEKVKSRRMDGTEDARHRDGVAIINVRGPITRYADSWAAFCGAQSVETLARDFDAAINNAAVKAILLNVDSPGGEVNGISEFADHVYAARQKKPVVCYVGGLGASAAYWIASAADEIVINNTAMLGSIGVVAAVPNPDAKSARDIEFVSSQSPNKRPNPNTESGRTQIQSRIDDLANVFIAAVARNRAVSTETVQSEFGAGGVLVGAKAVEAGLADRLGSFESTLAELAAGRWQRKPKTNAASAETQMEDSMNLEEIKTAVSEGVATAIKAVMPGKEKATDDDGPAKAELAEKEKQLADAQAQLAEAKQVQFKAEATAFVAAQITANKVLPAESDKLTAQIVQAFVDDAALPLAGGQTRVQTIKAVIEARPAHTLTAELVTDKGTKTLAADGGDSKEVTEARKAELMGMTPLGQTLLKAVK